MKAVTVAAPKGPVVLDERPAPKLRPGYMIVKPHAVAMNPADLFWASSGFCPPGALLGCDYAGVVEEVSTEGVTRGWKKGDRVCGATRPADPHNFENGAFAELVCIKADLQLHVPDSMSFPEASALGVGILTTGRAFYDKFGVEYPKIAEDGTVNTADQPKRQIFIYGGSSSMGIMYTQFAKLSNFHVITTCSPSNFDLVKSYGADHAVDYKSATAHSDLQAHIQSNERTMGKLEFCIDAIGQAATAQFCASVLNPTGSTTDGTRRFYSAITPFPPPLPGITSFKTLGYSFLGEPWEQRGQMHEATPGDFELAKKFAVMADRLVALGKIRPHVANVRPGGLEAVSTTGFDELRSGVSGKKLVFTL